MASSILYGKMHKRCQEHFWTILTVVSCCSFSDLCSYLYSSVTPRSGAIQKELSVGSYLNFTISLLEWNQPIRQVHLPQKECCSLCQERMETLTEKCEESMNDSFASHQIGLDLVQHIPTESCIGNCTTVAIRVSAPLRQTAHSVKVTS